MKLVGLRKELGMTQTELAERCETTQQQIAKIENGIVDPKLSTLRRLSEALECQLCDLFYSRNSFVDQINSIIDEYGINMKVNNVIDLNAICSNKFFVPSFHPYWEEIKIDRSRNIVFIK